MGLALILVILFILSLGLTAWFRCYALKKDLMDHPNHRSSHAQPTPRGGGVVFCALFLLALMVLPVLHMAPLDSFRVLGVPALMIALLGYFDDVYGLPAKLRFAVQTAAAVLFLYLLEIDYSSYLHGWLIAWHGAGIVLMIISIVWSTNLYNFMDGTDGIASMEAIFVYGVGGVLLWMQAAQTLAYLAWALVAAVSGFLVWNWPRAKIFMGDVASSFLGFLIIPFALFGYFEYGLSVFVWFILYLAFSMDATLTLLRRLLHKEKIWQAHKLHAYQRLHQAGYSHLQVLWIMMSLNTVLSLLAVLAMRHQQWLAETVAVAVVVYLCFYAVVEYKKPMYGQRKKAVNV